MGAEGAFKCVRRLGDGAGISMRTLSIIQTDVARKPKPRLVISRTSSHGGATECAERGLYKRHGCFPPRYTRPDELPACAARDATGCVAPRTRAKRAQDTRVQILLQVGCAWQPASSRAYFRSRNRRVYRNLFRCRGSGNCSLIFGIRSSRLEALR